MKLLSNSLILFIRAQNQNQIFKNGTGLFMSFSEPSQDVRGLFTENLKESRKEPGVNFKPDKLRDEVFLSQ